MASNASEKRLAAIHAITDRYVDPATHRLVANADKDTMSGEIWALCALGRTERWQYNVERWQGMVREATPETLEWALHQGAIFAAYAAL